jgi:ATP phosphoribosyltransferase regulatory subunit
MSDINQAALLPTGTSDVLPPSAEFEEQTVAELMRCFAGHGYDRVKPPLIEFEDGLLSGDGAAMAMESFRLMDPVSQRMMAVRPDITLQVARIATTRLRHAPRPLRLSYAGEVLRVRGAPLRPDRQFTQVGAELIGSEQPAADAEVIVMAVRALETAGLTGISVDLGLPTLVPAMARELELNDAAVAQLRIFLDRKDAVAIAAMGDDIGREAAELFVALVRAAGPARDALAALESLALPPRAAAERDSLNAVVADAWEEMSELSLTIDPVEARGFEYHTGVTSAFFASGAKGGRGELGRGGRYLAGDRNGDNEPATGLTLFMDAVLRLVAGQRGPLRVLLAPGTSPDDACNLRADGWITLRALDAAAETKDEARRLGCSHVWSDGKLHDLANARED